MSHFDVRPSNWNSERPRLHTWDAGRNLWSTDVPSGATITTIHFDNGNEDIHADITDYINSISGISGSTVTDYGIGICCTISIIMRLSS
jgi:hypothetical protein